MILAFKQTLSQCIAEGTLIITATRRLAKQWQAVLVSPSVTPTPQMLSQADWLNGLWNKLEASALTKGYSLLNEAQEKQLWRDIIASCSQGAHLLRLDATSEMVIRAAGLLQQWNITLEDLEQELGLSSDSTHLTSNTVNEETRLFLEWAHAFYEKTEEKQLLSQASLPNKMVAMLSNSLLSDAVLSILNSYSPTKKIKLFGFEDITPQSQLFYTQLRLEGWDISELTIANVSTEPQYYKYAFYDQASELRAAAMWAKSLSNALDTQSHYSGAIGIVIPDLSQCRSLVESVFTQVLEPQAELQVEQQISEVFNITLAQSLMEYPIVFAALKAFALLEANQFNVDELLFLIRSPFIGLFGTDMVLRAQATLQLQALEKQMIPISELSMLFSQLTPLLDFRRALPHKCSMGYWSEYFEQFLKLIGWPGERALNSIEHQAMDRWQRLLAQCGTLELVLEPQNLQSAIRILSQTTHETTFQGQSKPAPIHIMGILEASNQPFEYLWVSGLHNEAWPPIPKANPFLPLFIQRKYHMPHASSEREYFFAQKLTDHLKNACDNVVFSFYQQDSIKEYQPSDLIADIHQTVFHLDAQSVMHTSIAQYLSHASQLENEQNRLESISDEQGPVIQTTEYYQGGTGLIQAQHSCPFKAFVQYRLHVAPKQSASFGLNAAKRGILIHAVLEKIWMRLQTHQQLCALSLSQLEAIINPIIQEQIDNIKWQYIELPNAFWEVELLRIKTMMHNWLDLEKKRPPFQVIAQEKRIQIELAGLQFKLRLDRVDLNEQGETIIIDYKTGAPNMLNYLQLSIYGMGVALKPKALIWGYIQAQGCAWDGVGASNTILPGIESHPDWDALLSDWHLRLEELIVEFKKGSASVAPEKKEQTCRHCHLSPICRIQSIENA